MISREQLKNEIDTIDETHLEVLHRIILAFKPSSPPFTPINSSVEEKPTIGPIILEPQLSSDSEPSHTIPSLFSRLRQIKISGPADFSENIDAYLNGEKDV
jgi:hypothetical protein